MPQKASWFGVRAQAIHSGAIRDQCSRSGFIFVASPSLLRCLKGYFNKTLPAKNQQLLSFSTIGLCVVKLSHCNTIFSGSPGWVLSLEEASLVEYDF